MKKFLLLLGAAAGAMAGVGAMPDGVCAAENLIHRWSFASNAVDSVGGTTGTLYGTAAVSGGQLVLKGGNKGASYANLGTGMIPMSGAFTIELWAKKTAVSDFGRIFDIGTSNSNYIYMAWNRGKEAYTDEVGIRENAIYRAVDDSMRYVNDTFYHIAISCTPQNDGATLIRWSGRNLKTGLLVRGGTIKSQKGWKPSILTQRASFYLGHSQWDEPDSASAYEEVRVWNTALTDDQIAWSAWLGPDKLPTTARPTAARPVPREIFGQNIEHTRAIMRRGLLAQRVYNRKFAGKPENNGVAMGWDRYGEKGVFEHLDSSFTHHANRNRMWRWNEERSQMITGLDPNGEVGIQQEKIALRAGVSHTFRAVMRALAGGEADVVLRVLLNGKVMGEKVFHIKAVRNMDWKRLAFSFTPTETGFGVLQVGVKSNRTVVVGAVSLMADDNFRGMRPDVIAHLAEIGATVIRWPGGNFSGEYRWRDGYIADPDERAPLQAYTEIESQPYNLGYDTNDLATDDIIALCEKIGAEPYITLNPVFDSIQDSVEWVRRTKGRVTRWSLGNEMGYGHMEGPKNAKQYTQLVRPHAEAVLKEFPYVRFTSSGLVPGPTSWIHDTALPLNDVAPVLSYHHYCYPGPLVFCTEGRVRETYAHVERSIVDQFNTMYRYRAKLPAKVKLSKDEWNIWATWYREDGPVEGLFTARMLHRFMKEWEALGIEVVCYFQAINENAIRVSPFSSRLTTIGHAFRLLKSHIGGLPVEGKFPVDVFATDAKDGTRFVTCLNFKPYEPCTYTVPAGACTKIVGGELLEANGVATGAQFVSKKPTATLTNGTCTITVPPASLISVRLGK